MKTETINQLKADYVAYFEDVPVQKYAAEAIAKSEDTIIRWRQQDPAFADAIQRAKAGWIRKRVLATKAEFALERLEKSVFSQSSELRIDTGVDVKPGFITDNVRFIQDTLDILMEKTKRV